MKQGSVVLVAGGIAVCMVISPVGAALPDHPIITELYSDPSPFGNNDGPTGRDPSSLHREFFEIYLPPAESLNPSLNKDALQMTIYEVEGDNYVGSINLGLVNYRIDLPAFDLDPSNGITAGAVARPSTGIVVVGWVDYIGNPPTALAGTASTRIGLINGGITATPASPDDFVFVALNGGQFDGTTNFPIPAAVSRIDITRPDNEDQTGLMENGAEAILLVDRDSAGYVQLFDNREVNQDPTSNPDLPGGTKLMTSALLDALAGNDDGTFDVTLQPYDNSVPANQGIDFVPVLPLGGAFSLLVPQIPKDGTRPMPGSCNGYARLFADRAKTTEDARTDSPSSDAINEYHQVRDAGPFFPTPGKAAFTTSSPELSAASDVEQVFGVLSGTTARPGVLCANIGGSSAIDISVSVGASSDSQVATFAAGTAASGISGQSLALPTIAITPHSNAADGATATATATITASNGGGPAIANPVQTRTVTAKVLRPTAGQNAAGQPFQATAFLAVQNVPSDGAVLNELVGDVSHTGTSFGAFLKTQLGKTAKDTLGNGSTLINSATDISNPNTVRPMVFLFPSTNYINPAGPVGKLDLYNTVLNSAEMLSGATTYSQTLRASDHKVRAINIPVPETRTFDGVFAPSEPIHFAEPTGFAGDPHSGLSNATVTSRTFELVLLDTNVTTGGILETGATDDFGIVLQVKTVDPGSPVVVGEFVFLSFSGGLQGADVDTLQVPPGSTNNVANLIYLDLDNLRTTLGVRTFDHVILVDSSGTTNEPEFIEVFSLSRAAIVPPDFDADTDVDLTDYTHFEGCITGADLGPPVSGCTDADLDHDGDADQSDFAILQKCISGLNLPADPACIY